MQVPNELLVTIGEQLHFYDLLRFEQASKYLFNYFTRSNTWKNHYQGMVAVNNYFSGLDNKSISKKRFFI